MEFTKENSQEENCKV